MTEDKTNYQVAVVGGGPSGSAAVMNLKKNNLNVVLIDKADFPRDKICGDGIPLKTFKLLEELGFSEDDFFKDGFRINGMYVYSPNRKRTLFGSIEPDSSPKSGCIPRKHFDNVLFQRAASVADKSLTGHKVIKIDSENNKRNLTLQKNKDGKRIKISVDLVIAADGANSLIAKQTGLIIPQYDHHFDGLRIYYKGQNFDPAVHIFYDKRTLPGYVWIFPVGKNIANVGIMVARNIKRKYGKNIRQLFTEILNTNPDIIEVLKDCIPLKSERGAPLRLGSLPGSRIADGVILIGDAASFINPLTGGGIYFGIRSAKKAAEYGSQAIISGDVSRKNLYDYEKWWRREILPGFFYSNLLKRLLSSEKLGTWYLDKISKYKPLANFFIMTYGNPLHKYTIINPLFWAKVFLGR